MMWQWYGLVRVRLRFGVNRSKPFRPPWVNLLYDISLTSPFVLFIIFQYMIHMKNHAFFLIWWTILDWDEQTVKNSAKLWFMFTKFLHSTVSAHGTYSIDKIRELSGLWQIKYSTIWSNILHVHPPSTLFPILLHRATSFLTTLLVFSVTYKNGRNCRCTTDFHYFIIHYFIIKQPWR